MIEISFTAAVFTGGPPRPEMTAKAIRHIELQSHRNIQKILISNGRRPAELEKIFSLAGIANGFSDWEVVALQEVYEPSDLTSPYRVPGRFLLPRIVGEFLYVQNDDDFLSPDFFELINEDLLMFPDANTAIGFPINYFHDTGLQELPPESAFKDRPLIEQGQDLFDRVVRSGDSDYGYNPGFSWICKTSLVRKAGEDFFTGGLMEWPGLFQIVPSGRTIFDRRAKMFLGRHKDQQRYEWTDRSLATGILYSDLSGKMYTNLQGANRVGVLHRRNREAVVRFFTVAKASETLRCLYTLYKLFKSKEFPFKVWCQLLKLHLGQALKTPWWSLRILARSYLFAKFR